MKHKLFDKLIKCSSIGMMVFVTCLPAVSAEEYTEETYKKMGVFLSNFTETGLRNFERSELNDTPEGNEQIINFAIKHLRINTPKKYESYAGEYGLLHGKAGNNDLTEVIFRYFGFKNFLPPADQVLEKILPSYDKKSDSWEVHEYTLDLAEYVKVTKISPAKDDRLDVEGYTYYPDLDNKKGSKCTAVVAPHSFSKQYKWEIVSLHCDPYNL